MKLMILLKRIARGCHPGFAAGWGMLLLLLSSSGAQACEGNIQNWSVGNETDIHLCIRPSNPPVLLLAWDNLVWYKRPSKFGGLVLDASDARPGAFGNGLFFAPILDLLDKKQLSYRNREFYTGEEDKFQFPGSPGLASAVFALPRAEVVDMSTLLKQFRSGQRTKAVELGLVTASFNNRKHQAKMLIDATGIEVRSADPKQKLMQRFHFDFDLRIVEVGTYDSHQAKTYEPLYLITYTNGQISSARINRDNLLFDPDISGRVGKITHMKRELTKAVTEFSYDAAGRLNRSSMRNRSDKTNEMSPPRVIDLTYAGGAARNKAALETLTVDGELALRIGYDLKGWPLWYLQPGKCVVFLDHFPEANGTYRTELTAQSVDGKTNCLNAKMAPDERIVVRQ